MRRLLLSASLLVAILLSLTMSASAAPDTILPNVIPLPNGFQPEGIVVDHYGSFYVGSLADGAIYAGSVITGEGGILVPGQEGRVAAGLAIDPRTRYLFAAGAGTGAAYVYDADTGAEIQTYQLFQPGTASPTFINDVVVTPFGAFFTDSFRPVLYRLSLELDGALPDPSDVEEIELGGDFEFVTGTTPVFNTNGIVATPNGRWLIIGHTALGALYRVDPLSGKATLIDLGGDAVPNADGLVLDGRRLFVVQNFLEQISAVRLDLRLTSGEIVDVITDPLFDIPTTADGLGPFLWVVNARFGVTGPDVEYQVVRVLKYQPWQ